VRYLFEHLAVAVCAVTGVLAASNKRVDLFGVVVLALVTALGGGTLRDLILGIQPFWVADATFVLSASAAAGATFLAARFWNMPLALLLVADACGLALFTMVGTERAILHVDSNIIAVLLGVMTGVVGGMIRDVLTGEIPLVLRSGVYLYATAALCGAMAYVLLEPRLDLWAVQTLAILVTLVLRLTAVRWRLKLPEFKARKPAREEDL
jgi:uncharacterized membrane protein YeiH